MGLEGFQITTVYADGRTEVRNATPEEIEQRQRDAETFQKDMEYQQQMLDELEARRNSGRKKLVDLGLTEDEINSLIPPITNITTS